ncbi:hypothetical protein [Leptospira levettii]|uniref:hypothetical protein n=1 Tax=Leptospira levettii TaxID=2023178 RepID=UPI00223CA4A7|nr:hypothetical protein [Leptospira levettii]MCW7467792.1 hypothetical protein [Leptospira levettii]MCW7472609.1 hypothetical protein [Leptospira levettii]
MEIMIKNKAGELKIVVKRIDPEFRRIDYFLELNQGIDWEKVFLKLDDNPRNALNSHWVKGYEERFGMMIFNNGNTVFSGLRDIAVCTKNLKGKISEEFGAQYFQTYLDSFIHRMIYLEEIICSIY